MSDLDYTQEIEETETFEDAVQEDDTERRCALCGASTDSKTAPILTMGHYGEPRYLCPHCADELDRATLSRDVAEIEAALDFLSQKMDFVTEDYAASEELGNQLATAAERLKKIREGTYDFAEDEVPDEGIDDIPEELRESEEDKELDRKDAESLAKFDKISGYVLIAAAVIVAAILICRYFFA